MDCLEKTLRAAGRVERIELSRGSSFRIGGSALCFYPSDHPSLAKVYEVLREIGALPVGGMSNILFSSAGIHCPLISLSEMRTDGIKFMDGDTLFVGAGVPVAEVLSYCIENGLSGLEFIAGMPAAVGGLVSMDAGFKGMSMSQVTVSVDRCEDIVLSARLRVSVTDKARVLDGIRRNIEYRKAHQEWGASSAGCVFSNPDHELGAGAMIDRCGLKGIRRNGARISEKHANFIVNDGGATSDDVVYLIETMREKVYRRFGVLLQEEIIRVDC
jgi:UDP-N-acetylmuramate dehydrogenase